jgi:hypothetical protein
MTPQAILVPSIFAVLTAGLLLLQVMSVADISKPSYATPGASRLLLLKLHDGRTSCKALEHRNCSALSDSLTPGSKVGRHACMSYGCAHVHCMKAALEPVQWHCTAMQHTAANSATALYQAARLVWCAHMHWMDVFLWNYCNAGHCSQLSDSLTPGSKVGWVCCVRDVFQKFKSGALQPAQQLSGTAHIQCRRALAASFDILTYFCNVPSAAAAAAAAGGA